MKKALHIAFTQYIATTISMSITLRKLKFYMLNEKEIEVRNQCTLPAPWSSIHIYFHQNSIKHFVKSDEKGRIMDSWKYINVSSSFWCNADPR